MPQTNIYGALQATESRYGNRVAIRFIEEMDQLEPSIQWTYHDLLGHLRGAANLFHDCGVNETSTVALLVPNIPYGQVALFAAEIVGCALPVNPLLHNDHIISLLKASNAKVLVCFGDIERAQELQKKIPTLQYIFMLGEGPMSFEEAIKSYSRSKLDFPVREKPETIVATFHTGGTTGTPKLVQHMQSNQLAVAHSLSSHVGITHEDVIVNALPLFHVAGSMCFAITSLVAGASQILCTNIGARHPDFIKHQWTMQKNHHVTIAGGVPTTIGALVANIPDAVPETLQKIITGGAMLPVSIESALEEKLGLRPYIIYGMTECAGLLAIKRTGDNIPHGWVGQAVDGMEIRIVGNPADAKNTQLPPMQTGHVIACGAPVSPGYTNPELNKATFTEDGWLITGDLGMMDKEGNLKLTGRAKDLIIRSGHNIDPASIEEAALKHSSVTAAAAVGAPDGYAGELPVLFIVVAPAVEHLDVESILSTIRENVERPAVPRWIESIESLPMTAVGKIYKPVLVAKAIEITISDILNTKNTAITLDVVESNGIPNIHITALKKDHKTVTDLMAPFTLDYKISEPT